MQPAALKTLSFIVTSSSLGTNNNWGYSSNDLDFNFMRAVVSNAVSYKWDFGDGTNSTLQNPAHSFINPGAYTVKISAANNCSATYEFSVQVNVPFYKALNNTPATGFQQVLVFSPSLIYFLGTNEKLYKTDTSGNWSTINLPPGLTFNSDAKLYKDLNNNLWIYGRKEVARLNNNGTWTSFFSSADLPKNATVNSIAVDRNSVLWTVADGDLRKGNRTISSNVQFSSLAYAVNSGRIWIGSLSSNNLFYVSETSTLINSITPTGIVNGSGEIKVNSTGEIYFTVGTGLLRTNSTGSTIGNYNSGTTGGMITVRPSSFDFDGQGNLWVVASGQLYKLPVGNSGNTKKYSFNADLGSLISVSVLNLSGTDSDILLAKTSGNAAIKIR